MFRAISNFTEKGHNRHNRELSWVCSFSAGANLFKQKKKKKKKKIGLLEYIFTMFTVLYLILIYEYEIYLLPQVWNEMITDNQHNIGKLEK